MRFNAETKRADVLSPARFLGQSDAASYAFSFGSGLDATLTQQWTWG